MSEQEHADVMVDAFAPIDTTCEGHPWKEWPHDDCAGPGMPARDSLTLLHRLSGVVTDAYDAVARGQDGDAGATLGRTLVSLPYLHPLSERFDPNDPTIGVWGP